MQAHRRFFSTLAAVLAVPLLLLCEDIRSVAATASSVVVETTPALPLVDVVFLATTSAGTDRTLYVSSTSDCAARLTPICTLGRAQAGLNYNETTCVFNITGASINVYATTTTAIPELYWCSSAAGSTAFASLQLHKVLTTPPYAYLSTTVDVVLNDATPVGAVVGLYTTSACSTLLTGTSTMTVSSSRTLSVNVGTRGITYVCAAIPTVLGTVSVMAARTILYGTSAYDIYTVQGIRHRSVTISADATFLYLSLSTDPQCTTLAQAYQQTSSGNAVLTIDVSKGTYYFCAILSAGVDSIGVFVPAMSMFEVLEYAVQPQTMYANYTTTMTFALDAVAVADSLQAALFSTAACSAAAGTQLTAWSSTMEWAVAAAGTYYACVRTGTSATAVGYVNNVVVSAIPSVTLSRTPAIMGLGEVATVTRSSADTVAAAVVSVGIASTASCTALLSEGSTTTSGTSASFYVSENSPSVVHLCVSNRLTTDQSDGESSVATTAVYYSLGTLPLSTYSLTYPALRTETALTIDLDPSVSFASGTYMYLAPAPASDDAASSSSGSSSLGQMKGVCDAAIAASPHSLAFELSGTDVALAPVTFPIAGSWLLCVKELDVLNNVAVQLRTLAVYGNATVSPQGVLPGIPATLRVTAIPSSTTVMVTDSAACSAESHVVATTTSSLTGTASLSVTYASLGSLLLCVGYRGEASSQDTAAVLMTAGQVESTAVRVVPRVATAALATQLTFAAPGAPTLAGYTALLIDAADAAAATCPTSTAPSVATQLTVSAATVAGEAAGNAVATATFTPETSAVGTTYMVCVGTTGAWLNAGLVTVMTAPTLTTDPATLAFGLPATVTLPSTFTAVLPGTAFVVIPSSSSCTVDLSGTTRYASGAISTTSNATEAIVMPSRSTADVTAVRFCVAVGANLVNSTLGYADAGTAPLQPFTAITQYAQRGRGNTLRGSPTVTDGSLYLVQCESIGCGGAAVADGICTSSTLTHYTTSPTESLTAPVGTYVLCQSVATFSSVVGASTTVEVIDPYVMYTTANTTELRLHIPFAVTVSGGPASTSGTYTVVVQPLSVDCATAPASESQTFSIVGGSGSITITDLSPLQNIHFCVRPSSADGFEVLAGYLLAYTTPAAVIAGTATTLVSGAPRAGASAMLATGSDCAAAVTGGAAQALVGGAATFTVAGCDATTRALKAVHYCETGEGGQLVWRGAVQLLRASSCSGGELASILPVSAAPGVAIVDYGLTTSVLTRPWLSASPSCDGAVDRGVETVGYAPRFGESAVFYVCAELANASSVVFTTAAPTLTVLSWRASPSAALSRFNATMGVLRSTSVSLNYATPTAATFFSASSACEGSLGSAAALGTTGGAAAYRTTGVRGLVYVCTTDPLSASTIAVAALLSVTPPSVVRAAPAIVVGVTYTATLMVDGEPPLYAMQPGVDAAYAYSAYYTSRDRNVFLSADGCATGIAGVADATAAADGRVRLATSAISTAAGSVALCAGTAAGTAVVLAAVPVATGSVYPTRFVAGGWAEAVFIPIYPDTNFQLSASAGDCTLTADMPSFTTDSEGYGSVNLVTPRNSTALPAGTYMLCASGTAAAAWIAVEAITVFEPSFFSVRGTTFIVGVPSTMELQQDLVSSYLYSGFSESRECTTLTSAYGTWTSLSSTSIQVSATATHAAGLYLCAQAPHNESIIALPVSSAASPSLIFATSSIELPASGWDVCTTYAVGQCYPPGSSSATASDTLAMVHGGCCSATRVVVGESNMAGGACQLAMDRSAVEGFAANATFDLCVLSSTDAAACTTVATGVRVSTSCRASSGDRGLSSGALAAAVSCSILGVLGLIVAAIVIYCCCCRKRAVASKASSRELVAFQEFADDDHHLVGYLIGGRHPLLYYPSGSHVGRSVSPSPPYPSTGSATNSAAEALEEERRDQIALEEARARYNLRLRFSEALQTAAAAEKNAEVDAGLDVTWASGDSYLRGVARPERRCVESIITDASADDETAFAAAVDTSALSGHGWRGAAASPPPPPEERDLNVTADVSGVGLGDAVGSRRRKVRSRSIESTPQPPLSPAESYLTNDDFEEQEESTAASGDEGEAGADGAVPQRRVVVRRFVHPAPTPKRRSAAARASSGRDGDNSTRREASHERPHLDPTQLDGVARVDRQAGRGVDSEAGGRPPTPEVAEEALNDSAVLARSPIASPDAQDLSEGAVAGDVAEGAAAAAAVCAEADEVDLLSFTTTQRFHDELQFVLEQEDGRRQRLLNWEEEERAAVAQAELGAYASLAEATQKADGCGAVQMATPAAAAPSTERTRHRHRGSGEERLVVAQASQECQQGEEEEEEEVYHAPAAPATLPALPAAPRPQALQNGHLHVASTDLPFR